MLTFSKINFFRFLLFALMITTYLPVLTNNLPPVIRSHHFWAPIWAVSILLFVPIVYTQKSILYFAAYGIIIISLLFSFWSGISEWDKKGVLGELYEIGIAFSMLTYIKVSRDYRGFALVTFWTVLFVFITSIMSIYSSFADPLYARKMISGVVEEIEEIRKFGGGGYGFAASLVCIFPMVVYYYRNNKILPLSKRIILLFGIFCLVALLRIQIFANIVLSFFVIIFALAGRRNIRQSFIIAGFIFLIFIILPDSSYSGFLQYTSNYFDPGSEVYFKLNDLSSYIELEDEIGTATASRISRYPLLFEAFSINPVAGSFNSRINLDISPGAHLYWMYKLTTFGILIFIPFVMLLYFYIKNNMKQFNQEFKFYFLLALVAGISLGFMKAIGGREFWYMFLFIIPGMYYLPLLNNKGINA